MCDKNCFDWVSALHIFAGVLCNIEARGFRTGPCRRRIEYYVLHMLQLRLLAAKARGAQAINVFKCVPKNKGR